MNEFEIIQHRQIEGLSVFLNTIDHRTPHIHPEWELIWVLRECLSVTSEQSQFLVSQDQMVLFCPNSPHELHKADKSCTFLCIQISPKLLPITRRLMVDGRFPHAYLTADDQLWVKNTLKALAEAYFTGGDHYELFCLGQASLLLHKFLTQLPSRVLTPEDSDRLDRRNARLNRMIRYVDENYMNKIRLSDFAKAENCSTSYLSHFIKDATNQTFQEYVNSVRFNCACKLIAAGGKRMLDVCMESGFSDYRYFSRAFHQQYGMTPAEYGRHARQMRLESAVVRHSLHSVERFYSREDSLRLLRQYT